MKHFYEELSYAREVSFCYVTTRTLVLSWEKSPLPREDRSVQGKQVVLDGWRVLVQTHNLDFLALNLRQSLSFLSCKERTRIYFGQFLLGLE